MAWVSVLAPDTFAGPAVWQYLVKGCITDAKGGPASGTVVTLDLLGVKPATADTKGCYQIHDVPLGIHRVTLTRDGTTVLTTRIELWGEKATVTADFQLKEHAQTLAAGLVLIDLQALSAAERRPDAPPPLPGVPGVASLTFHPSRVRGGDTAHAVARLSSPAPPGGYRVKIAATVSTVFAADVSVLVPEGSTSAPIAIPTKKVSGGSDVKVKLQFYDNLLPHTAELVVESSTRVIVKKSGSGAGIVVSIPPGITCGNLCSAPFAEGMTLKFAASAATGSEFAGWSGDCKEGQLTVTGTMTCVATFNPL